MVGTLADQAVGWRGLSLLRCGKGLHTGPAATSTPKSTTQNNGVMMETSAGVN